MKKAVSNARTSMIFLFSSIISENYKKMMGLDLRAKKLQHDILKTSKKADLPLEKEFNSTEKELAKSSIIVIVFSAMAVEAYIYDYAARHLGDTYVKDHLEKLDTLSKWVIIPELITGREMPHRENWRGLLTKLIKTRNSIIHHKSSELPSDLLDWRKQFEKQHKNSEAMLETAKQSITLLDTLADKIIEMDPEEAPWVKAYLA
jgi:hypothetical protein